MKKTISLKSFYSVTGVLVWIGYTALAAMVLIVLVDASGRYLLNKPLRGSYELVKLAMITLSGFAIMYTTVKREHVGIDLLFVRVSGRAQTIMRSLGSLLGIGTWAIMAYAVYRTALAASRATSDILLIPTLPFRLTLVVAIALCVLTVLIQTLYSLVSKETPEGTKEEVPHEY